MESSHQPRLFADLPDCAAERDDRALDIDKVGIKDLMYPVQVLDKNQKVQHTVAQISLYVGLPHHFKGTHMSRFIEVLNTVRGEMTLRNLPSILGEIQRRLEADTAHLEMDFPYFISKKAPVTKAESLMEYQCSFRAVRRGGHTHFTLVVRIPVTSLCPCSKAISNRGAHNQRSLVVVEVQSEQFLWIEDVVETVERCASAPLYALLKREDEKFVTEQAYDNPRFVEDLVRDVVLAVRDMDGVQWLKVEASNEESIHNHAAYAEIEWSRAEAELSTQLMLPLVAREPLEPRAHDFGSWLREQRAKRNFSQQELAELLAVSPSFLSRVEKGEKGLSAAALEHLAEILGADVLTLRLRAGQIPAEYLARISREPERFRSWCER